MLNAYLTQTKRLLQNPPATAALYSDNDLTSYINTARGQVAGDGQCIRSLCALTISPAGGNSYQFVNIVQGLTGVNGVLNIRQAWVNIGSTTQPLGRQLLRARSFPWFGLFSLNNPIPAVGPPQNWTQLGQGAGGTVGGGTIMFDPFPDQTYTVTVDCVGYPAPLTTDTDPEAIPYLWTDAVPFFAAYYALMASQTGQRDQLADKMYQRYQEFTARARRATTAEVLPWIYAQGADPFLPNQLGLTPQKGGGGGQGA